MIMYLSVFVKLDHIETWKYLKLIDLNSDDFGWRILAAIKNFALIIKFLLKDLYNPEIRHAIILKTDLVIDTQFPNRNCVF